MLGMRTFRSASCILRLSPLLPSSVRNSVRDLRALKSDDPGSGHGTKLMQAIAKEADSCNMTLILIADTEKLEKWYEKFGFKTAQREPAITMIRVPR